MTPWEVILVVEAKASETELQWELAAWQTAHLLNVHLKKGKPRITADKLLGRVITVTSGAEARAHMERISGNINARDAGG